MTPLPHAISPPPAEGDSVCGTQALDAPDRDRVAIVHCPDYREATVQRALEELLTLLGGSDRILPAGTRVYVKPNLAGPFRPERAVTTHPALVRGLCRLLAARQNQCTIGDSPAGVGGEAYQDLVYRRTGMRSLAAETGARLDRSTEAVEVRLPPGALIRRMQLRRSVVESPALINLAKLKTHLFTGLTGAVKNLYGTVQGSLKLAYHATLPDPVLFSIMLRDLAASLAPGLTIVDAVVGMEGDGPTWGRPRHLGYLIGGLRPLAVDAVLARLMGLVPDKIPLFLDQPDLRPQVVGVSVEDARPGYFKPPGVNPAPDGLEALKWIPMALRDAVARQMLPRPKLRVDACLGCGHCTLSCPNRALTLWQGKAVLDQARCLRCWTCHEVCPHGAVRVELPPAGRLLRLLTASR